MAHRETQLAETEAVFREVDEGIAEAAERFEADQAEFVCECSDPDSADRVAAPLDEYEQVRADGTHFLLAPGHERRDVERVVRRRRGYAIVEKVEATMRRVVRRLDPRARPRRA